MQQNPYRNLWTISATNCRIWPHHEKRSLKAQRRRSSILWIICIKPLKNRRQDSADPRSAFIIGKRTLPPGKYYLQYNNLISIKEKYGSTLTLMAGIEPQMLEAGEVSLADLEDYERMVRSLSSGGGFILSSSSGLYSGDFFERIQDLYRIADGVCEG